MTSVAPDLEVVEAAGADTEELEGVGVADPPLAEPEPEGVTPVGWGTMMEETGLC